MLSKGDRIGPKILHHCILCSILILHVTDSDVAVVMRGY